MGENKKFAEKYATENVLSESIEKCYHRRESKTKQKQQKKKISRDKLATADNLTFFLSSFLLQVEKKRKRLSHHFCRKLQASNPTRTSAILLNRPNLHLWQKQRNEIV